MTTHRIVRPDPEPSGEPQSVRINVAELDQQRAQLRDLLRREQPWRRGLDVPNDIAHLES